MDPTMPRPQPQPSHSKESKPYIEQWLDEGLIQSRNVSDAEIDDDFVMALYRSCVVLFAELWRTLSVSELSSGFAPVERFILWGEGFDSETLGRYRNIQNT